MYLDASAIVAILAEEDDAGYYIAKLEDTKRQIFCSPMTVYEAVISLARNEANKTVGTQSPVPQHCIDNAQIDVASLLDTLNVKEMSMNASIHVKSIAAAREYGKIVASPARLNMGDCFVYALAKEYRLPLLFKGDDFTKTDIERA
ncbi:type II toxin-antitoxin system VapC family toxin [Agrobacterium sp. Azo12]|jgi:ribonuclease VapC|uniref:type II toxin-antitoxin system VapC family toxin n=1 Tax=Agrobacterium sp. Azo12 TaxID=3031129 RepID=UPI0023D85F62|nr:type II toxin-antitoxin system VapC family toxin [Agrobacterium sp. Azo12]MDO5897181.1 type II toxin-antitoxin system VapC family toxin [Agrobacterium sp. Azo12]